LHRHSCAKSINYDRTHVEWWKRIINEDEGNERAAAKKEGKPSFIHSFSANICAERSESLLFLILHGTDTILKIKRFSANDTAHIVVNTLSEIIPRLVGPNENTTSKNAGRKPAESDEATNARNSTTLYAKATRAKQHI